MLRSVIVLALMVCTAACTKYSEPEKALRAYASSVIEGRCNEAFDHLSTRTRHALSVLSVKPQHQQSPLPIEEYYCRPLIFEDCKLGETTLDAEQGGVAKVSMMCGKTQDSILPGFTSPFLKYEPRAFELVYEDGKWRTTIPLAIKIVEKREEEDQRIEAERRRQEEFRKIAPVKPNH